MKKTITEITEKFDASGKVIERVTKTTTEETPYTIGTYPDWTYRPYITYCNSGSGATLQSGYAQSATTATNKCESSTTTASYGG